MVYTQNEIHAIVSDMFSDIVEKHEYVVFTENRAGQLTDVYAGNNWEQATETTNFWDERMNTYLVERAEMRRWFKHNPQAQIQLDCQKAFKRIETLVGQSYEAQVRRDRRTVKLIREIKFSHPNIQAEW